MEIINANRELLALLRKPVKNERDMKRVDELQKIIKDELKRQQSSLLTELKNVGILVTSVWDLVNTKQPYKEAIPILIRHLPLPYHDKITEGIIRALTVKEASGLANKTLINEYKQIPKEKSELRWLIGNAMTVVVTKNDIPEIVSIVENKNNGESRDMFVLTLTKFPSDKIEKILINLLDDDEILSFVVEALGRIRSKEAKEKISELANHQNKLVKEAAKKALIRIE